MSKQIISTTRFIIKPHFCRKYLLKNYYHNNKCCCEDIRYLKRNHHGQECTYCVNKSIWYVVEGTYSIWNTTSISCCEPCMNKYYNRCRSHQKIKTVYDDNTEKTCDKYCAIVFIRDTNKK